MSASCLKCSRSESDVPLVVLQFVGKESYICPQCLPTLIHHPDQLTEKLIAEAEGKGK
jgi:hypothetical protein